MELLQGEMFPEHSVWKTRFGKGYGPVERQTAE
jgi:hypothetical protein